MNHAEFKAGLDTMLRDYAHEYPQADGGYSWIASEKPWEEDRPSLFVIPLYRMRALPAPFRIAEQEREATAR